MQRREFLKTTVVSTIATPILQMPAEARPTEPLRAAPRVRYLHIKPARGGKLLILSDGAPDPRKLIKQEVLDRAFGTGTYLELTQPDHWQMIDQGWFAGVELFGPLDHSCAEYWQWHAYYRPECEAHDLLYNLFQDQIEGFMGGYVHGLGLEFAEHPCSPRLATVKLAEARYLPALKEAVAAKTEWVVVDPKIRK